MAKVPAFAKAFAGRWRIVEMDVWDHDVLDIGEEAHFTFEGASNGEIAFVAVKGFLDVRYGSRDGAASAEFSWQGTDDEACGRAQSLAHQMLVDRRQRQRRRDGDVVAVDPAVADDEDVVVAADGVDRLGAQRRELGLDAALTP